MGTGSAEKHTGKKQTKKNTLVLGVGLLVAVVILITVVVFLLKSANIVDTPALEIGDRKVSKKDYNAYVELGKGHKMKEDEVRSVVIEYNKNQIIAKERNITIPDIMMDQVPEGLTRNILQMTDEEIRAEADEPQSDDGLSKMQRYNFAFGNYLSVASKGGWGVVVYDFPLATSVSQQAETDGRYIAGRKQAAQSFRDRVASKELTTNEAIKESLEDGAGQASQTGLVFVGESDGSLLTRAGGPSFNILYPDTLLPILKTAKPGLTDIKMVEGRSIYFLDVLFKAERKADIVERVTEEKEKIKVVDYVRG